MGSSIISSMGSLLEENEEEGCCIRGGGSMGMYGSSLVLSGEVPRSSDRISRDALLLCRGSVMGEDDGRDIS